MARGTGLQVAQRGPTILNVAPAARAPAVGGAIVGLSQLASTAVGWVQKEKAAAEAAYLGKLEAQARRHAIDLRDEYAFDPEGFDTAWAAYSNETIETADDRYKANVETTLGQVGTPAYGRIVDEKRAQTRSQERQTLSAMATVHADRAISLGRAGQAGTDQYNEAVGASIAAIDLMVEAGHMSREMGDLEIARQVSEVRMESLMPQVLGAYRSSGPVAALRTIDSIADDPKLQLSPEERDSFRSRASARVNREESMRATALARANEQERATLRAIKAQQEKLLNLTATAIRGQQLDKDGILEMQRRGTFDARDTDYLMDLADKVEADAREEMFEVQAGAVVTENASQMMFDTLLSIRDITPAQHDTLSNMLNQKVVSPDQEKNAVMANYMIDTGDLTDPQILLDAMDAGELSPAAAQAGLNRLTARGKEGGVLAGNEYRFWAKTVSEAAAGKSLMSPTFSGEDMTRSQAAVQALRSRVLELEDPTTEDIQKIGKEIHQEAIFDLVRSEPWFAGSVRDIMADPLQPVHEENKRKFDRGDITELELRRRTDFLKYVRDMRAVR